MELYAKYYDVRNPLRRERITELLEVVGLLDRADFAVGSYSGGMKRRLELVRSLVHRPRVLFLDDPTTGLDPQARIAFAVRAPAPEVYQFTSFPINLVLYFTSGAIYPIDGFPD